MMIILTLDKNTVTFEIYGRFTYTQLVGPEGNTLLIQMMTTLVEGRTCVSQLLEVSPDRFELPIKNTPLTVHNMSSFRKQQPSNQKYGTLLT